MKDVKSIVVALNDFEMVDGVLSKAVTIAKQLNASLSILYVIEKSLFDLPIKFFESVDKDKVQEQNIKNEIKEKLVSFGYEENCATFVFMEDTVDCVLEFIRADKESLIILSYHKDISKKVVQKSHLPVLVVKKSHSDYYKKIVVPTDFTEVSKEAIDLAKSLSLNGKVEFVYDFQYMMTIIRDDELTGLTTPHTDIELNEADKRRREEEFESLQKESGLNGYFIEGESSCEKDLSNFIDTHRYDLAIIGSNDANSILVNSVAINLLENLDLDILIYAP